jgi:hypothetical protein
MFHAKRQPAFSKHAPWMPTWRSTAFSAASNQDGPRFPLRRRRKKYQQPPHLLLHLVDPPGTNLNLLPLRLVLAAATVLDRHARRVLRQLPATATPTMTEDPRRRSKRPRAVRNHHTALPTPRQRTVLPARQLQHQIPPVWLPQPQMRLCGQRHPAERQFPRIRLLSLLQKLGAPCLCLRL